MSKQPARGRYRTPDTMAPQSKSVIHVQLIAIVTLALSTLIAATAVSIGHARADVACAAGAAQAAPFIPEPSMVAVSLTGRAS